MSKRFKKNTPNKYQKLTSAITLDAPIEERTPFVNEHVKLTHLRG
jgi:hypothetical protein